MNTVCLSENYSTTRLVIKEKPDLKNGPDDKFKTVLFLPKGKNRKGEGGLRLKGYFKKSYPGKPLITVVTVVFNGEKYLEETILSVISQTYDNVEYIIIDGDSTDSTLDIIKKYNDKIDYWVSEKDDGISDAFNKGIICATGSYFQILNTGDLYLYSGVVSKNVCEFTKDIISYQAITDTGKIFPFYRKMITQVDPVDIYEAIDNATISHQAAFVRDKVYKRIGLYNTNLRLRMDFDIFFRIQREFNILRINKPVVHYRTDGISSKLRNRLIFKLEEVKIVSTYYSDKRYVVAFYFTLPMYLLKKILSSVYYFFCRKLI